MSTIGLLTLMLMKLNSNQWPDKLDLVKTRMQCKEMIAYLQKDGYKYVGIKTDNGDYMTDYTDQEKLENEINKQCKDK